MMISENRFFIGRRRNPGAESNVREHYRPLQTPPMLSRKGCRPESRRPLISTPTEAEAHEVLALVFAFVYVSAR
jgi:hypothetical protein